MKEVKNFMNLHFKIELKDLLYYVILIPFLYPRGFNEYSFTYKLIFTVWMYTAIFLITLYFSCSVFKYRIRYKIYIMVMLIYYTYFIIDTLIIQGNISTGLQKLFATPTLCIICAILLKSDAKRFIKTIANILIVILALDLFLFNSYFFPQYFDAAYKHILFIGHVQTAAQIGVLGIFIAFILKKFDKIGSKRALILFLLSISILVLSKTAASYLSLCILFFLILLSKMKFKKYNMNTKSILILYILSNIILFLYLQHNNWRFSLFSFDLNGRGFIWKEVFDLLKSNYVFGYGAQGALITVFWSAWIGDGTGMNYAHNDILQLLLDGGIILVLIFFIFIYHCIKNVKNLDDVLFKSIINIMLILYFLIMTFESTTNYFYIFIFLSIIANIHEITKEIKRDKEIVYGNINENEKYVQ